MIKKALITLLLCLVPLTGKAQIEQTLFAWDGTGYVAAARLQIMANFSNLNNRGFHTFTNLNFDLGTAPTNASWQWNPSTSKFDLKTHTVASASHSHTVTGQVNQIAVNGTNYLGNLGFGGAGLSVEGTNFTFSGGAGTTNFHELNLVDFDPSVAGSNDIPVMVGGKLTNVAPFYWSGAGSNATSAAAGGASNKLVSFGWKFRHDVSPSAGTWYKLSSFVTNQFTWIAGEEYGVIDTNTWKIRMGKTMVLPTSFRTEDSSGTAAEEIQWGIYENGILLENGAGFPATTNRAFTWGWSPLEQSASADDLQHGFANYVVTGTNAYEIGFRRNGSAKLHSCIITFGWTE